MTNLKKIRWFLGISALAMIFFAGCAEKGPILLDIGYPVPEGKPAAAGKVIVGVSSFRDERGKPESVIGIRTIPSALQNDLVVQGTVSGLVAASLKDALKARGFTVKDVPAWDLTAEGMKTEGIRLLFGGVIRRLWLESTAVSLKTHVAASVQLRIVAGDPADGKIVKTLNVESSVEQDVLYSPSNLEDALSQALGGAIDQIFNDDDLKKKLQ
jgi:uncharacterized lipoprotein YajG